jgi:hypothetical protein
LISGTLHAWLSPGTICQGSHACTLPSSYEGHMGGKQGKKYVEGVEGGTLQARLRPRTQAPTRRRWEPSAPRRPRLSTRCGPRTASASILGCTTRTEKPSADVHNFGGMHHQSSASRRNAAAHLSALCSKRRRSLSKMPPCDGSAAGGRIRKSGQRTSRQRTSWKNPPALKK